MRKGVPTYKVDALARVDLLDLLFENFGSVDRAAGGGHAGDEDLGAIGLEDLLDTAPVGDL
jgi:hypothetical protein